MEPGVEGKQRCQGAKKISIPALFLDSSGYVVTSMALQGPHSGPEVGVHG